MRFAIVLVAAGAATRMGFSKLWIDVCGQSLLARAVSAAQSASPAELVVVVPAGRLAEAQRMAETLDGQGHLVRVVPGGARRRDSVAAGLAASSSDWLAIHDAARALAPVHLFQRGLAAAQATGAAVPGAPLKDTIKRVLDSRVVGTPERAEHVAIQTPQIFRRDVLQRALALNDQDVTDEAALVEQLGISVAVFAGDERAFKVTTPLDFTLARALLDESSQAAHPPSRPSGRLEQ